MTTGNLPEDGVQLRLGITGDLGVMDYSAVLFALQSSYQLLQRTAHRVLGDRADEIRWHLTGVHEGSIETLVRADATDAISEDELREVLDTYTLDLMAPAERLSEDDVPILRELLQRLEDTGSGGLLAQRERGPQGRAGEAVVVEPSRVLPALIKQRPTRQQVIGGVTGRIERLNVHGGRREASLWNEMDQRRVIVSFGEADYPRVYGALRQRVEVFGLIQEDADGRPLRIRLQDLEVISGDEDLPTLSSLIGSMPGLTEGLTAQEYLERNRRELGLG